MSHQYKLKKYLTKLENESNSKKMDLYYSKIKKYKLGQTGGVIPNSVTTAFDGMEDQLDQIKKAHDASGKPIDINAFNLGKLDEIQKSYALMSDDLTGLIDQVTLFMARFQEKMKDLGDFQLPDMSELTKAFEKLNSVPIYDQEEQKSRFSRIIPRAYPASIPK